MKMNAINYMRKGIVTAKMKIKSRESKVVEALDLDFMSNVDEDRREIQLSGSLD